MNFTYGDDFLQHCINTEQELRSEIRQLKRYIEDLRRRMTIREIIIEQGGKEKRLVDVFDQSTNEYGCSVRIKL